MKHHNHKPIRFHVTPVSRVNADVVVEADKPYNGRLSEFGLENKHGSGGQLLVPPYTRDLTFRVPKDEVHSFKAKVKRFLTKHDAPKGK